MATLSMAKEQGSIMGRRREKIKGRCESGSYCAFIHNTFTSPQYYALSHTARSLLNDIYLQFKGENNGDFCIAPKIMHPKGWTSQG